jgi:uncharacterized membrane protein YeaQ/YmgE (transglycosylase-associated protein family)
MSFIVAIIMGLIIGAIAKFIMPGRDPGGIIVTCLLGICGSLIATWLGQQLGWYAPNEGAGFIGGIIGAIILLVIYRMIFRSRSKA